MPRIIDYPAVQEHMRQRSLVSLYHNSGAFGFAPDAKVDMVGWIGPDDPTIREAMRPFIRQVNEPHAPTLANLLTQAWLKHLSGEVWLLPKSHWHYELHFGNTMLLEDVLKHLNIDPAILRNRNSGDAIAFSPNEAEQLRYTIEQMLKDLAGSDFLLAFANHPALCTVHHHRQLWWQTTSGDIYNGLNSLLLKPMGS